MPHGTEEISFTLTPLCYSIVRSAATLATTSTPTRVTKAKRSTSFPILAKIVTTGIVTIQTIISSRAFAVTIVAPDEESKQWLRWIYWVHQGVWDRAGVPEFPRSVHTEPGMVEADRILAATVEDLGGHQVWSGIVPTGLHGRLVVRSGMSEEKASKLITKLAKTAREAAGKVWSARCAWVNETGTNADTKMMWRTAVRRVAQNRHMAVGSLNGVRAMPTKQFAAWRRKLVRFIADEEIGKNNRARWEEVLNAETDFEFGLLREANERNGAEAGRNTAKGKMDERQKRTAVQAAGDASERADGAMRRARKGWEAPRMVSTPLLKWHGENWAKWELEVDLLMAEAAKYEIGRGGTNEAYEEMMKRLKHMTHATEKLVGVQRSALARTERVEEVWRRWLNGNGWVDRTALRVEGGRAANPIVGEVRWASRLRKYDEMGRVLKRLQEAWGLVLKMSKKWDANEEMGRWWEDREDEFGIKLTLVRARLEEALYGEERLATTALAEAR